MLHYDPGHDEGMLYLFNDCGCMSAKEALLEDIPRLVAESGDSIAVSDFHESTYNAAPAHADDVHAAIIENPGLEVLTPAGGERRRSHTIGIDDSIELKRQRGFFPMFLKHFPGRICSALSQV